MIHLLLPQQRWRPRCCCVGLCSLYHTHQSDHPTSLIIPPVWSFHSSDHPTSAYYITPTSLIIPLVWSSHQSDHPTSLIITLVPIISPHSLVWSASWWSLWWWWRNGHLRGAYAEESYPSGLRLGSILWFQGIMINVEFLQSSVQMTVEREEAH